MLVFINTNLVCKSFRFFLEEVMTILCLFIGYQPQFPQKSNFSHKSVILRNWPFQSFRFRKKCFIYFNYILSQHLYQKYRKVLLSHKYLIILYKYVIIQYYNVIHSINNFYLYWNLLNYSQLSLLITNFVKKKQLVVKIVYTSH